MRLLKEIMRQDGLALDGKALCRGAVRGIIANGRRLLMIHSSTNGDYSFPGGGSVNGETHEQTLVREIKEESGADVLEIKGEFGKVIEYDAPTSHSYDLFVRISFYYICTVDSVLSKQSLEPYERDLGFRPVWVDIDRAIETNRAILSNAEKAPRWTARETYVLEQVKAQLRLS